MNAFMKGIFHSFIVLNLVIGMVHVTIAQQVQSSDSVSTGVVGLGGVAGQAVRMPVINN
jgi:hypothetical protein